LILTSDCSLIYGLLMHSQLRMQFARLNRNEICRGFHYSIQQHSIQHHQIQLLHQSMLFILSDMNSYAYASSNSSKSLRLLISTSAIHPLHSGSLFIISGSFTAYVFMHTTLRSRGALTVISFLSDSILH